LNIGPGGTVDERRYTINTLPTNIEPKDGLPVCNATHACVLYVGQNQNNFEKPHVWSAPFYVGTGVDAAGTSGVVTGSGSGSSAPLIVGIVVAALVLLAGSYLWLRHRKRGQRTALA
jgi:LPXTG-motif cell wall-anchored protein